MSNKGPKRSISFRQPDFNADQVGVEKNGVPYYGQYPIKYELNNVEEALAGKYKNIAAIKEEIANLQRKLAKEEEAQRELMIKKERLQLSFHKSLFPQYNLLSQSSRVLYRGPFLKVDEAESAAPVVAAAGSAAPVVAAAESAAPVVAAEAGPAALDELNFDELTFGPLEEGAKEECSQESPSGTPICSPSKKRRGSMDHHHDESPSKSTKRRGSMDHQPKSSPKKIKPSSFHRRAFR